jgi:hypothetical protein
MIGSLLNLVLCFFYNFLIRIIHNTSITGNINVRDFCFIIHEVEGHVNIIFANSAIVPDNSGPRMVGVILGRGIFQPKCYVSSFSSL